MLHTIALQDGFSYFLINLFILLLIFLQCWLLVCIRNCLQTYSFISFYSGRKAKQHLPLRVIKVFQYFFSCTQIWMKTVNHFEFTAARLRLYTSVKCFWHFKVKDHSRCTFYTCPEAIYLSEDWNTNCWITCISENVCRGLNYSMETGYLVVCKGCCIVLTFGMFVIR